MVVLYNMKNTTSYYHTAGGGGGGSEGVSGFLELQLQPSCKLKTQKKGHYVFFNAVKVISKVKV